MRVLATILLAVCSVTRASALEVGITPSLESIDTIHDGNRVTVQRNQDRSNRVKEFYSYTSRKCPPFCIQPMQAAPGVETYGELEVLEVLGRMADGDDSVMVVDTRTRKWQQRGIIPGAVNIPWVEFDLRSDTEVLHDLLEQRFGVTVVDGKPDFSHARTAVLYCNGPWCSQSTNAVEALLSLGYPPGKVKWYRGGMQNWELLGLTTVKPVPQQPR